MPGLSQLKQFNADLLSLGNEPGLRSSRGEKPVTVPIPKSIKDVDDSNDFVLGMPEIPEEQIKANTKVENVVEDFSDIMGVSSPSSSDTNAKSSEVTPDVSGIDLSSLMGGVTLENSDFDLDADLSDFDEPEEEVVQAEPEPEKEPEIGDLSLDDLLSGAGFDGTEGVAEEVPEETSYEDGIEEIEEASADELLQAEPLDVEIEDITPLAESDSPSENIDSFDDITDTKTESFSDSSVQDLDDTDTLLKNIEIPQQTGTSDEPSENDFELEDAANITEDFEEPKELNQLDDEGFDELNRGFEYNGEAIDMAEGLPDEITEKDGMDDLTALTQGLQYDEPGTDYAAPDAPLDDFSDENKAESSSESQDPLKGLLEGLDLDTSLSLDDNNALESTEENAETASEVLENSSGDDFNFDDVNMSLDDNPDEIKSESSSGEDSGFDFGDIADLSVPDFENDSSESDKTETASDNFDLDNIDSGVTDLTSLEANESDLSENKEGFDETTNVDMNELESGFGSDESFSDALSGIDGLDDLGSGENIQDTSSEQKSEAESDDFLSGFDFNIGDSIDGEDNGESFEEGVHEDVDISQMAGLEFPETDAQISNDFELGSSDDFGTENGDFEIPGFSDVQTAEVNKNGKIKVPEKEVTEVSEGDKLPPNTLSDEQFEKYKKNLSSYPLNVRIAVEELIVKNEFTDEAEFEIVQKVLKKVSARQLASELEKMLDISISVPRDFERRTAEEYEAYKKSFQYQLRNKIIPGAIMVAGAALILTGLFFFGKNFIVRPMIATSLYKQGYEYLESADYPQSEVSFVKATKYAMKKKWFFKYAHGYREHKQYIRAEQMYNNILKCFAQDKIAGLEYANMELYDLANYEKSEEILLREVLDYHINDSDAIMLLGDTYLEWATEKDESKFENARSRYAEHIQLYGENDLNMAGMLRYYIRTDDLKNVLTVKQRFMPKAKSLDASGWTEMSGFLLDKLYGELAPSDEYLRTKIEDVKECLTRAIKADGKNPVARYNMARYFIKTHNTVNAKNSLVNAIAAFDMADTMKKRDLYKYIDSYRLLGEEYSKEKEYLRARELYTNGLDLYLSAHNGSGFEGNHQVGLLYADLGDLDYFISGDMDAALQNYKDAVDTENDNALLRYKIGYIQYTKQNYSEAIGSFMKAGDDYSTDNSLLLAMGNTLSLKGDNYAAQGYYEHLLEQLDYEKEHKGVLLPQVRKDEAAIVESYLKASNNLGVTLYKLARRTGNSAMNAKSMVMFQDSMRAWDSMTRNQETLVRLPGGNLAEQNMKYVSHPIPDFEPAIYTELPRTLSIEKGLKQ